MAKTPSKDLFKSRAKALREAGITRNFDLRRNPTEYEKRKARELYNRFEEIIQHPEKYHRFIVSRSTANQIDQTPAKVIQKNGKVYVFIKTDGKKATLNKDKSITVGERGKDQIIHTYYKGGAGIFETAHKLFEKLPDYGQMIEDEKIFDIQSEVKKYVTVAIGDNMPFHRALYTEEEFNYYIAEFKPNDAKNATESQRQALKERLIQRMVAVEVYSPDAFDGETVVARRSALRIYKGKTSGTKKAGSKNSGH